MSLARRVVSGQITDDAKILLYAGKSDQHMGNDDLGNAMTYVRIMRIQFFQIGQDRKTIVALAALLGNLQGSTR